MGVGCRMCAGLLLLFLLPHAAPLEAGDLCFNELQVLGTHNSYHQAPPAELLAALGGLTAGPLLAWQYSHPPIGEQLDAGVRAFELDAFWDPSGGLFGQAAGLRIAGQNGWLSDPAFKEPGFKVLHVPDFDVGTSCVLLRDCLAEIKRWSDANPRHLPIRVYIEVKEAGGLRKAVGDALVGFLQSLLDSATAEGPSSFIEQPPNTVQTFLDLNAELAAAFGGADGGAGQLLTPDGLRGMVGAEEGADLAALLRQPPGGPCPWPSLDAMRGKVLAVLILQGGSAEAEAFQAAFPDLRGSLAWVEQNGRRPLPQAAFRAAATGRLPPSALSLALPANASAVVAALAASVRDAAEEGFLVRARADADTVEARAGYTERRDAIIAAGPQVVASDFVVPGVQHRSAGGGQVPEPSPTYSVALPGGQAGRCLVGLVGGDAAGRKRRLLQGGEDEDGIYCGPVDGAAGSNSGSGQAAPTPENGGEASSLQPLPQSVRAGGATTSGGVRPSPLAGQLLAALVAAAVVVAL